MRQYTFQEIKEIAFELKNLKAAIIETDTVMGIVSLNPELIYQIKNRTRSKKLITFTNDISYVEGLNKKEKEVLSKYWPGKLTIIKKGISYRIPNHPQLLLLLNATGNIFSSSANISDEAPVQDHNEAKKVFQKHLGNLIVVEGKNITNQPSTIIDLDRYVVIREGAVNGNSILEEIKRKE